MSFKNRSADILFKSPGDLGDRGFNGLYNDMYKYEPVKEYENGLFKK
jgi:hypothetical protein